MEIWEIRELIENNPKNVVSTPEGELRGMDGLVYLYITSPFGTCIWISRDGRYVDRPCNETPADWREAIAVLKCPGWENLDTSVYTGDFEWDDERKVWIDSLNENQVVIDPVAYLIREVGLQEEEEEILQKIKELLEAEGEH